jgi:hypothetical protein
MEKATNKKRKAILIGLGVLGTGVAGFLGWNYWRNKKKAKQEEDNSNDTTNFNIPAPSKILCLRKQHRQKQPLREMMSSPCIKEAKERK